MNLTPRQYMVMLRMDHAGNLLRHSQLTIEEIAGNREKAKELFLSGQKNWPDELDFRTGEIRLKKKKG
mgnify:CR=1 FL=1